MKILSQITLALLLASTTTEAIKLRADLDRTNKKVEVHQNFNTCPLFDKNSFKNDKVGKKELIAYMDAIAMKLAWDDDYAHNRRAAVKIFFDACPDVDDHKKVPVKQLVSKC